ncbi:phosphodiester glycosidase family protein [Ensifer soli]|uniref:phosphodiester glycosidase family protein n=1 Tax=Ciceribacter sp. sgz301302 TaxID=3342379 RepID=UPI0035B7DF00
MKRHVIGALASAALAAIATPGGAAAEPCAREAFEGGRHVVCTLGAHDLARLGLYWRDADGKPFRGFSRLDRAVREKGGSLVFAVNAGMYLSDYTPMGLYVAEGSEERPVNTEAAAPGIRPVPNFFKEPNGVFFVGAAGAGVATTRDFVARRPQVRLATQSGPMLVMKGRLNPIFIVGSKDRTRRSGVGVCEGGAVKIAVSEGDVNFHDFARLFRDRLGCPDALFLDGGNGVGLFSPALRVNDWSWHGGFGPMLGFVGEAR